MNKADQVSRSFRNVVEYLTLQLNLYGQCAIARSAGGAILFTRNGRAVNHIRLDEDAYEAFQRRQTREEVHR